MPIIQTTKRLRPRDPHDHYPTPLPLCREALRQYAAGQGVDRVLDPGAGTGVWGAALRQVYRHHTPLLTGIDLRALPAHPAYDTWLAGNYLTTDLGPFDLVLGNPPYALAEPFIRRALAQTRPRGQVIFLLRLAFLATQERGRGLWADAPPHTVSVCSRRPSFTGNGKTDATDYAVFLWFKGWHGTPALEWLQWGQETSTAIQEEMQLEGVA
jgi:hypothetical protein